MSQEQHDYETERELYEQEQDALPPHKRDGYAERMYELADDLRKRMREEQF